MESPRRRDRPKRDECVVMGDGSLCALCRQSRPLLRSHLMPKALYRMCRSTMAIDPNPIALGEQRPRTTSQQATRELLCSECEGLLSASGERYVVGGCRRPGGSFAIRDILMQAEPHAVS